MGKIESRTATIKASDSKVFTLFSDLTNFDRWIPRDKVNIVSSTPDSSVFEIDGIGRIGVRISEKNPNNLVKINSFGETPFHFKLCINITHNDINTCLLKVSIEPDVNPFILGMVKSHFQNLVDVMIDRIENFPFS